MAGFSADVTPVILTKDEEANLGRTLGQLRWAREVVVVDSGSTDRTREIALGFDNVRFVERPFDDLASQWTFAIGQADSEWVLMLDADYFVSDEFANELHGLEPEREVAGYVAAFLYAIRGKPLRASLYPPRVVLARKRACSFVMDGHTQRIHVDGPTGFLKWPIIHDDRKPFRRFVQRQRVYMREEAEKIRRGERLNFAAHIRRLRVVAPFAVLVHLLFGCALIMDGVPGLMYTFERVVAEAILSWELIKPRRR